MDKHNCKIFHVQNYFVLDVLLILGLLVHEPIFQFGDEVVLDDFGAYLVAHSIFVVYQEEALEYLQHVVHFRDGVFLVEPRIFYILQISFKSCNQLLNYNLMGVLLEYLGHFVGLFKGVKPLPYILHNFESNEQ